VCVCVCVCRRNGRAQFRTISVKLGETGIETFNKLKQAYREHALSRSQVQCGIRHFQRAVNSINMNPALEALQLHKLITMCS
jgi:hypothetical protein